MFSANIKNLLHIYLIYPMFITDYSYLKDNGNIYNILALQEINILIPLHNEVHQE